MATLVQHKATINVIFVYLFPLLVYFTDLSHFRVLLKTTTMTHTYMPPLTNSNYFLLSIPFLGTYQLVLLKPTLEKVSMSNNTFDKIFLFPLSNL